jgi:hypothetical protein
MAKRVIQLMPGEKRKIEIRYLPTAVGVKENAMISFKSTESGDYIYNVTGTGKPPQPLSPTLVSSAVDATKTATIVFTNPFPYPARFSMSISNEHDGDVFQFLVKRKVFSLSSYGEEFQIPFAFSPTTLGQFRASIVVASLGPARGPLPELESLPAVRWVYPIVGNAVETEASQTRTLKCRSQQKVEQQFSLTLIGESETFAEHGYVLRLELPKGYEYVRSILELRPVQIQRTSGAVELIVTALFTPQRPFQQTAVLVVGNPLGQEWTFAIELVVDLGKPVGTIVVESLLNKVGKAKVQIPATFRTQVPFHAYFAAGSGSEFSVSASHGMIEPTLAPVTELPIEVSFAPKMYGKLQKALLIVDTMEAQFLLDIVGKTPEYVPPVVSKGVMDIQTESTERPVRKRNAIRENIENARITKPRVDQK